MKRGGKFLVSTMMLAIAGCGGEQGKREIRSTPTPLAQGKRPVPERIAEARGQLAIGNVALALEAFRIAYRENPNSTDALIGMATCYDQMGRYDLSRRNYETALAIAPSDVQILGALASSLQLQGRTDEALNVRREIAARASVSAGIEQQVAEVPAPLRRTPEVAPAPVAQPPALVPVQPVQLAAAPDVQLAPRTWAPDRVDLRAEPLGRVNVDVPKLGAANIELAMEAPARTTVAEAAVPAAAQPVQTVAPSRSVTVKLPAARPVSEAPIAVAVAPPEAPVAVAGIAPLKPYARPVAEPSVINERGPRLERMSMGEIALITVPKPEWAATTVARSERSTTLRFVPLRQASAQPIKVRLLNAARVNRLAAKTRVWLAARGWRGLSIGNAQATRARSVILYPADQRALAQRLSAQFGFPMSRRASGSQMLVLLGTDAVRHRAYRSIRV